MEPEVKNYKTPLPQKIQSTACVPTHVTPLVKMEELANKCFSHRTSLPVDADFSIRYAVKEEGLSKKQFGVVSEDEFIAEANGKFFKVINASFLDNGVLKSIERSMDITNLVNLGAKPEEIRFVVFATDLNGKMIYLSGDYDKNVLDWAEKTGSSRYKLRNEIIGENRIWDYMVGKEKQEMMEIFEKAVGGALVIREVNVSPEHFDKLQCKNKSMTHVICTYSFSNGIFMQDAVNISPLSHKMWALAMEKQLERHELRFAKTKRIGRKKGIRCIRKRRYGMIEPVPNFSRNIAVLKRKKHNAEHEKNARRAEKFMNSFSKIKLKEIKCNSTLSNPSIYGPLFAFSISAKPENPNSNAIKNFKAGQKIYFAEANAPAQKTYIQKLLGIDFFAREKAIETKKSASKSFSIKERNKERKKPKKPAFFYNFSASSAKAPSPANISVPTGFGAVSVASSAFQAFNATQSKFYAVAVHFNAAAIAMHFKTAVPSNDFFAFFDYAKMHIEPLPIFAVNLSRSTIEFPSMLKIIATQNFAKRAERKSQHFFQRQMLDYFFALKIMNCKNILDFKLSKILNLQFRKIFALKKNYASIFSILKLLAVKNDLKGGIFYVP